LRLKKIDIFGSNIELYLSLGLFKRRPSYRISLQPVLRIRIHMFLGLLDPDLDPLVRGMDPDPDPALDPDPSIIMQK
jgi:hypothetical protein